MQQQATGLPRERSQQPPPHAEGARALYERGYRNGWGNRPCADAPRCVCLPLPRGLPPLASSASAAAARAANSSHSRRRRRSSSNSGSSSGGSSSGSSLFVDDASCGSGHVASCWPVVVESSQVVLPIRVAARNRPAATRAALHDYVQGVGYILRGPPPKNGSRGAAAAWPPPLLANGSGGVRVLEPASSVKCVCAAPSNATTGFRERSLWAITTASRQRGDILSFKCRHAAELDGARDVQQPCV